MNLDPRTPVIIGAGQFLNRVDRGADPLAPTDLMIEAARLAETDSGASLLSRAELVAVVPLLSWRYRDPGRIVADAFGASSARTWYPAMGGNTPQMLLNRMAAAIDRGELEVGILCGGESWNTRTSSKRSGERPEWTVQPDDVVPDWGSDDVFSMGHPAEHAKGIVTPVQTYPLFETALMHEAMVEGTASSVSDHIDRVGEMWAGFSRVAAANPYAWRREALTASDITTATPENRFVGWPYTKRMVSNPDVDMASALIVTSAAAAESAGVPRDRWVFCCSGTDGTDRVMSQRQSFTRSPSIGVAGRRVLELAGADMDDVAHLDVYSCFPSAVQLFCAEFDLDPLARPLTVYGGLSFAGGPWNNPVGHALASMVGVLREDTGSIGLVTANGGNVDKHAFGVFSTTPPADGFRYDRPQGGIDDAVSGVEVADSHSGPVTIEAWSVMHDRDNSPERLHAACRTPEGTRVWGVSHDPDFMLVAMGNDLGGTRAELADDGDLALP